jgi:hypothetical protein
MMLNGQVFERRMSVRPIAGNASSSWHTPDTMPDAPNKNSNTRSKPPGLGNQAQTWLTPSANEDAAGSLAGNMQNMLSHQVQQQAQSGEIFSPNDQTSHLRLNPKFVEKLMGFPEGWLSLEQANSASWGTEWSLSKPATPITY